MMMSLLGEALAAMAANRLRTFLTALGILIGVAAVVLMVAIGQGTQQQVGASIASMGSNLLIVRSGAPSHGGVRGGAGNLPTLTLADAQAIAQMSRVSNVAPTVTGSVQIVYGPNNWNTSAIGTSANYLDIRDWRLSAGRAFSESEALGGVRVALLGQEVAGQLFGDENPVGKSIRVQRTPFLVIGVLEAKGQSLGGHSQDDTILVPLTTAQRQLFGSQFQGAVSMVMVQAESAEAMMSLEREMRELLRQRHRLGTRSEDDFRITNMTEVSETVSEVTGMLSILLGAIASISLFVGGIGIMNIMMVSVTERTREIGIRMAIGARRRDILLQFLLEAVIITTAGGVVGIVAGIGLAAAATRMFEIDTMVTSMPIMLAFGVSVAVGVFFGLYPARKASLMRPIDALRQQG